MAADLVTRICRFYETKKDKTLAIDIKDLPEPKRKEIMRKHSKTTRITTIAYSYNRVTRNLQYGAVHYVPTKTDRTPFNRKNHNDTARKRLGVRPVIVEDVDDTSSIPNFNTKVRQLLYTRGVKGPRITQ